MIRHKSFRHGWFYHYRVHGPKTDALCEEELAKLKAYLYGIFESCPDEKFITGPRSSALRFPIGLEVKAASGHELCSLTKAGLANSKGRSAHTEVQCFLLDNDPKSIAAEIPLWLDQEEHGFMRHFEEPGPLTGHIDLLRVENGRIVVWDYKPKAAKEKWAATQTYAYALMLAHRTGIPLEKFRCGWFDEQDAYLFDPNGPQGF